MVCAHTRTVSPRPAVYRPRRPKETAFYRLVEDSLDIVTADPKPARSPPGFEDFEEPEFEDYLEPEIPDELYVMDPPFYED